MENGGIRRKSLVEEIRIYIEGGGDGRETKSDFRRGFSQFFEQIIESARTKRIRWRIIACGSRESCRDDFIYALESHPQAFNILLVDSECEVTTSTKLHLKERDNWTLPCSEDHCYLMAQTMEAWLIADPETLSDYYGTRFNINAIPTPTDVEQITKETLYSSLITASRNTQKGEYAKIRHGATLIGLINTQIVRNKAKHCDQLFDMLESLV